MLTMNYRYRVYPNTAQEQLLTILRTVFETEAETLILPLGLDLTEKAETRTRPLVTENCPDY